jgi:hypothetical protein
MTDTEVLEPVVPEAVSRLRYAYMKGDLSFEAFTERLAVLDADPDGDTSDLPALPPPSPAMPALRRNLDRNVLATLARITDPLQRCVNAGATARIAERKMEAARLDRNAALIVLHMRHDLPQAQCYGPYGIGRRLFSRAVANHPAVLPVFDDEAAARAEADRQHAAYVRERDAGDTARMVRDGMTRALTAGDYGTAVEPVDLARELGVARARISQVRSPKKRVRSDSAAARKARAARDAGAARVA